MKTVKLFTAIVSLLFTITSCVQQTHVKTVTFKLDMSDVENPSKVGVRGPFTDNPWQETVFLGDNNNDGIYEGTITQKTAVNGVQFKFVNNDGNYELRGQDNRFLKFEYKPETIIYETKFNDTTAIIKRQ